MQHDGVSGAPAPAAESRDVPVMMGFNASRTHAAALALSLFFSMLLFFFGEAYARSVVCDEPLLSAMGWRSFQACLLACGVSGTVYWLFLRMTVTLLPGQVYTPGCLLPHELAGVRRIEILRNCKGRPHLVALTKETKAPDIMLGGFSRMDDLAGALTAAVKRANPYVVIQERTGPQLILIAVFGLTAFLLTCYYFWIAVRLAPHTAPLLPLLPVVPLFALELLCIGLLHWTLAGFRIRGATWPFAVIVLQQVACAFLWTNAGAWGEALCR